MFRPATVIEVEGEAVARGGGWSGAASLGVVFLAALLLSGCAGARAFGTGALTPLEDLNVRREAVPPVLLAAAADPYGPRNLEHCRAVAWEVSALDAALGPDLDEPPAPVDAGRDAARAAGALTAGLLIDTAVDFIPVRDWVRQLSGAEARDREVQSAIQAGRQRRAFLKGQGLRMNCAPPAAPSWFRPRTQWEPRRRPPPPHRPSRPPWARY